MSKIYKFPINALEILFTIGRSLKLSPTHGCQGLSGPNYVSVDGNCYYIKETKLSIDDAAKSCQTAFGSELVGRLYEPKDKATHDLVIRAYNGLVGAHRGFGAYPPPHYKIDWPKSIPRFGEWLWLGINDKSSEGQFQYSTSGGNLLFTNWRTG